MTVGPGHDGEIGITLKWLDGTLVIEGECDLATAHNLADALAEHSARRDRIRCDVSKLTFCDSHCWGCFVAVVRTGVQVTLVRPSAAVQRGLQVTGLLDLGGIDVED